MQNTKVALITGASRRIGAIITQHLHQLGMNVIIHYCHAETEAKTLSQCLNQQRNHSASSIQEDLMSATAPKHLINKALSIWGKLDILINNASRFYPTPLDSATDEAWNNLVTTNLKAPYFLAQAAFNELKKNNGTIINIIDIHGSKPLKNYSIYSIAKAGLVMLTHSLALELAPAIRVNGIAPGAMIWPEGENELSDDVKQKIIAKIPLQKSGNPHHIAKTVQFLIENEYVTGEVITVDGGRHLS